MNTYCKSCGSLINGNARFCQNCGMPIDGQSGQAGGQMAGTSQGMAGNVDYSDEKTMAAFQSAAVPPPQGSQNASAGAAGQAPYGGYQFGGQPSGGYRTGAPASGQGSYQAGAPTGGQGGYQAGEQQPSGSADYADEKTMAAFQPGIPPQRNGTAASGNAAPYGGYQFGSQNNTYAQPENQGNSSYTPMGSQNSSYVQSGGYQPGSQGNSSYTPMGGQNSTYQGSVHAQTMGYGPESREPDMPMKWYNFVVKVQLILAMLAYAGSGLQYCTGMAQKDEVYALLPALRQIDVLCGVLYFGVVVLCFFSRKKLIDYEWLGVQLYMVIAAAAVIITLIHAGATVYYLNQVYTDQAVSVPGETYGSCAAMVIYAVCNWIYFNKRKHLFS